LRGETRLLVGGGLVYRVNKETCAVLQGQFCGCPWDGEAVRGLSKGMGHRKMPRQELMRNLHANDEDEQCKDGGVVIQLGGKMNLYHVQS